MASKSYSRSIRMTDEVRGIVENFSQGDGFNQKFEKLVLYFSLKEKSLDKKIKEKEKQISELEKQISDKTTILRKLKDIEYYTDNIMRSNSIPGAAAGDLKVK